MRITYKSFCVILCAILLFLFFAPNAFAEAKQGKIINDSVNMRDKATTNSDSLLTLSKNTVVTINGKTTGEEAISGSGTVWYNISYSGKTGFVYGKYVEEIAAPTYDADFEKNLLNFPKSYRSALRKIHNTYPNWVFIADKVDISLDTAIEYEYSSSKLSATKKWVELTFGIEWRDPRVDTDNKNHILETRWTYASRQAIAYYMDPRNALVVKNDKSAYPNIFTFLQHSYDSKTQTETGLKTVVADTFLANGYEGNKNAYISDIMQAAQESGVSPYIIASMIRIEQGVKGTSSLISGKYKGYEGYYNFFNYGAYGDNVVLNGLKYAKKKKWNTRKASIIGGAKLYAQGYINKGQDTYYYMDFDVKSKGDNQYAASLYDQCVKAVSMSSVCTANKNSAMTFKIPVYSSLPSKVYTAPTIEDYNQNDNDNEDNSNNGSSANNSSGGNNDSSKNDSANNSGAASDTSNQKIEQKKGDASGDGKVNGRDLAIIKLYLLELKKLKAEEINAADVSEDGKVNGRDLAILKMYLLGLKKL